MILRSALLCDAMVCDYGKKHPVRWRLPSEVAAGCDGCANKQYGSACDAGSEKRLYLQYKKVTGRKWKTARTAVLP